MSTNSLNPSRRSVLCHRFGDIADLDIVEGALPIPGAGRILIEVDAAGVGFVDGLIVAGRYQIRPSLPFTPGFVVAGRIAAVGTEAGDLDIGTPVFANLPALGGWTTHIAVPSDHVRPLPPGCDAPTAVAALQTYTTMHFALTRRIPPAPGEWVAVAGAGGAIGLAAVALVRSQRARVIGIASTPAKRQAAMESGAEEVIGYATVRNDLARITGGGVDVVIDPVGGAVGATLLRCLNSGGRYGIVGFASGDMPAIAANRVLLRNRAVIGIDWGDFAASEPATAGELSAQVLRQLASGRLRPPHYTLWPLTQVRSALGRIRDRRSIGCLVLTPRD
ncbi:zinc-binding dehydrogenase [Nocardia sp. R7R-8]|uniref:zinc-binding dehydrogenase n=1 Tax=Nocardia sp. R7R-8 TaxID=3459304 RepID=UPI00403E3559